MLWPDSLEETARFNLRQLLTSVRKEIGPLAARLNSNGEHLEFDLRDCRVDYFEFCESPAERIDLYKGALLEEFEADWIDLARLESQQVYLGALESLAVTAQEREGLTLLRKVVQIDPFRESARQKLISRLAELGEYASARAVYQDFEILLHRELGVSPSEATKSVLSDALEKRKKGITGNLPVRLTSFIGRDEAVSNLKSFLSNHRLVTLMGAGGCGKTSLAIVAAERLKADYPDGVWFVGLSALSDPDLVPQAIAESLGVRFVAETQTTQALFDFLGEKKLLLLLDNCEHMLSASATVAEAILLSCGNVSILATSRQNLGVSGEAIYRIPSLSIPLSDQDEKPERLREFEAVSLFVDRVKLHSPAFAVSSANAIQVASICSKLDGIPLAIEMAAARLPSMSIEELDRRLDQRFRVLTSGSRTALPRQQTLRSLVDWSYDLLNDVERACLMRLSVFSGGWTLDAAEEVCAQESLRPESVIDVIASLVDKSLVYTEPVVGGIRYRMLETICQYADEKLCESERVKEVEARHTRYFVNLAEKRWAELSGPDQLAWFDHFELEHDNFRTALDRCTPPEALSLAGSLGQFWLGRGYYAEGARRLKSCLEREEATERPLLRAKALYEAGLIESCLNRYDAADSFLRGALELYRSGGDSIGAANARNEIGHIKYATTDYASAAPLFRESLALHRELGNGAGVSRSLLCLGNISRSLGDFANAKVLMEESLALRQAAGNLWGAADTLAILGVLALDQLDYSSARLRFEESLALRKELRETPGIAKSLGQLGLLAKLEGDYGLAESLCGESLALWEQMGSSVKIAWMLVTLAEVAEATNRRPRARNLLDRSLKMFHALGFQLGKNICLIRFAELAIRENDPKRAAYLYAAASNRIELLTPFERGAFESNTALLRDALGLNLFASLWDRGLRAEGIAWNAPLEDSPEFV